MPIVIDELEIDTEQPETPGPEPTETGQSLVQEHLPDEDIMRIYRHYRARLKRVWAD